MFILHILKLYIYLLPQYPQTGCEHPAQGTGFTSVIRLPHFAMNHLPVPPPRDLVIFKHTNEISLHLLLVCS